MEIRQSIFDPDLPVFIAREDSPLPILMRLDVYGLGFAVWGEVVETPFIVIDGRQDLSRDELLAVEAHEVGHIMTGSRCERTAELFAAGLLKARGERLALELLLDRGLVSLDDLEWL